MYICAAKNCAWRAFYIYTGKRGPNFTSVKRFHLGIDPTWRGGQARLFGSVGFFRDCQGGRKATWEWQIKLPKSRHWWRLDGRLKGFGFKRAV
jgi:hypothetical protein